MCECEAILEGRVDDEEEDGFGIAFADVDPDVEGREIPVDGTVEDIVSRW